MAVAEDFILSLPFIDSCDHFTCKYLNIMIIKEPSLADLIKDADSGVIQLPGFQREFVWDVAKINDLLESLFKERPVGMATSWLQPQSRPHTLPIRFSIKGAPSDYGAFIENPAVISLVLDGRQRITTLLHVFTDKLCPANASYTHSNRWFINLDKKLGEDGSIEYCKVNKLAEKRLDTVSNCISVGKYPLAAWADSVASTALFYQPTTYPGGLLPDQALITRRIQCMQDMNRVLTSFKFPVAEISAKFNLSDVCEIFEILNTTGTRVSVFDLIHNQLFAHDYDLREVYKDFAKQSPGAQLFGGFDPVFYSQLVTTVWLARDPNLSPVGRDGEQLEGIKAKSLLNTPIEAFKHFESKIGDGTVAKCLDALYECIGGKFPLASSPYPASLTLFVATWMAAETDEYKNRLKLVYRSFYYRNSLLKRYTQGYLTKHIDDLKYLHDAIRLNPGLSIPDWCRKVETALDRHFVSEGSTDSPYLDQNTIKSLLLSADAVEGAQSDIITCFLLATQNLDLLTAAPLDPFLRSPDEQSVEIHHLYPQKWLANNKAGREEQHERLNCFANKVPLSRASNNIWKYKAPNTVLAAKGLTWVTASRQFSRAGVEDVAFGKLSEQPTAENIKSFWELRAVRISGHLYNAQRLGYNGF